MKLFIPTPFEAFEVQSTNSFFHLPTFKIEILGGGL